MDDIARACHKGKSSLYYYFNSKEEVFKAVIEYEAQILRKELYDALKQAKGPVEKIKVISLTRMRVIRELINFYEAMKNDYLNHLPFIEKIRHKYDLEEIETFKRILKEGMDSGDFVVDNLELYAFAIVTALKGLEIPLFVGPDKNNAEEIIESLMKILMHGIMVKK